MWGVGLSVWGGIVCSEVGDGERLVICSLPIWGRLHAGESVCTATGGNLEGPEPDGN